MENTLILGVYRRLDNRMEGLSDDSPRALELHNRRKSALHSVLDHEEGVRVLDWGETNDTSPHEFVEVSVVAVASLVLNYAIVPGLKYVGEKLAEKAVDESASELVKWLISKLKLKQEAKEILDFHITLPNGTHIRVDPPDGGATITVTFSDGAVSSVSYQSQPSGNEKPQGQNRG
jgi:hypothetical protein